MEWVYIATRKDAQPNNEDDGRKCETTRSPSTVIVNHIAQVKSKDLKNLF